MHQIYGDTGIGRAFKYRGSIFVRMYSVLFFIIAVLGGLGVSMIINHQVDENYLCLGLVLATIALFFVWGIWRFYFQHLSIVIEESRISTLAFGNLRHVILWKDVKSIEKMRFQDPMWGMERNKFSVIAAGDRIIFDDGLKDLRDCLDAINRNILGRGIELVFIDRGADTYKKFETTVVDSEQRRKLTREGVRTSLSEL